MASEHRSTALFREYLRIKSVHPKPDYAGCEDFLRREAGLIGLSFSTTECVAGKPVVVMTWSGSQPSLPSVMLNSHMDVVPVFPEHWSHDPFSAHKDAEGNIFGRGAQDMKCIGIQHLEAVRRLKEAGKTLQRTVHLTFVPDEELGGLDGMRLFVQTDTFRRLNVGFVFDEGLASGVHDDVVPIYYGERAGQGCKMTFHGPPGHGSRFVENTAASKALSVINKLMDLRSREEARLAESGGALTLGDVTTVNLNGLTGGVQVNVVPDKYEVVFDIRTPPTTVDTDEFRSWLLQVAKEADPEVEVEFLRAKFKQTLTSVASDDPWYSAVLKALAGHAMKVRPEIFPAGTDSKFIRELGIPCLGFSPMPNTPVLLHDHDEFLNEAVFLRGIDVFVDVIEGIANVA